MKKQAIAIAIFFTAMTAARSQSQHLVVHGETGKFYLEHVVDAKENWYSVGRMYNLSPKEIAPFNGLTMDKPLDIGQQLKIPLTALNFSQDAVKSTAETLVPIYHTVQEKEWMYHISQVYNKVPMESLEKWNHINRDQTKVGMPLVIGFLRVRTSQSILASGSIAVVPASSSLPVNKSEKKLTDTGKVMATKTETKTSTEQKTAVAPVVTTAVPKSTDTKVSATESSQSTAVSSKHYAGGYFASAFTQGDKLVSGVAGTFKSTSGWQDEKYYALMNNTPVGIIVKITAPSTGKTVYAKVLGQLPDMKESAGLVIRISNAAAAELGTGDGKFAVDIKF